MEPVVHDKRRGSDRCRFYPTQTGPPDDILLKIERQRKIDEALQQEAQAPHQDAEDLNEEHVTSSSEDDHNRDDHDGDDHDHDDHDDHDHDHDGRDDGHGRDSDNDHHRDDRKSDDEDSDRRRRHHPNTPKRKRKDNRGRRRKGTGRTRCTMASIHVATVKLEQGMVDLTRISAIATRYTHHRIMEMQLWEAFDWQALLRTKIRLEPYHAGWIWVRAQAGECFEFGIYARMWEESAGRSSHWKDVIRVMMRDATDDVPLVIQWHKARVFVDHADEKTLTSSLKSTLDDEGTLTQHANLDGWGIALDALELARRITRLIELKKERQDKEQESDSDSDYDRGGCGTRLGMSASEWVRIADVS
ncbi:uncharacterized protein BXZ73DRAFT_83056 [Epithele typhae]|uniref:uncharacterized protein n=1 Tax=Epithele typhae TaxID=378194 RepID=UPI002008727F|nr:uncharacterized protein BXZ73DRAFT_83056 [Epithele typhae]KAH9910919.1 hypothetical protein BXZ73DRAFT_83056 [Epithele typhae]